MKLQISSSFLTQNFVLHYRKKNWPIISVKERWLKLDLFTKSRDLCVVAFLRVQWLRIHPAMQGLAV